MGARQAGTEVIDRLSELTSLFDSHGDHQVLMAAVAELFARTHKADAALVFLVEDGSLELILAGASGLTPPPGPTRLASLDGVAAVVMNELRPLIVARIAESPAWRDLPGISSAEFQSCLMAPIVRGLARMGLVVLLHRKTGFFSERDIHAVRAITGSLALALENARLLSTLHQAEPTRSPQAHGIVGASRFIKGKSAAEGICLGAVLRHTSESQAVLAAMRDAMGVYTMADFKSALRRTEQQIDQLQLQLERKLAETASLIFSAHLLILRDEHFLGAIVRKIKERVPVHEAIHAIVTQHIQIFERSANSRIREKTHDLRDLEQQLLRNLSHGGTETPFDYKGRIIITGELLPSDLLKIVARCASGIILTDSGMTAHIAILTRSLAIPTIMVNTTAVAHIRDGTPILMDANQGNIFVEPDDGIIKNYASLLESNVLHPAPVEVLDETVSRDGVRVRLMANINLLSDLHLARKFKAEGIGLYRTEFPFIIRNDFPSEEEQYNIYRKLIDEMNGKEVVFRTLDIGGDKLLEYLENNSEANPFLGLRAIRFSLRNRQLFTQQLRALMCATRGFPLKIMFPMVGSVDDFLLIREIVVKCSAELTAESVPHNNAPQLGIMVEVPSAVEVIDELADLADFMSIGTNDLVQYILAVDRTNKQVANWYQPHHPAVLRSIKRVVEAARWRKKTLSVCGDMASDPRFLSLLLGLGIRVLSMPPTFIPKIQPLVRQIDIGEATAQADSVLRMGRTSEVARFLNLPPQWLES